jgi:hypothetical protein
MTCETCNGAGRSLIVFAAFGDGTWWPDCREIECPECLGWGVLFDGSDPPGDAGLPPADALA